MDLQFKQKMKMNFHNLSSNSSNLVTNYPKKDITSIIRCLIKINKNILLFLINHQIKFFRETNNGIKRIKCLLKTSKMLTFIRIIESIIGIININSNDFIIDFYFYLNKLLRI